MSNGSRATLVRGTEAADAVVHVVDDDPQMCKMLRLLLDSVGLEARIYSSAEEFLAAYPAVAGRPECLLLDICMRGMSGIQLQRKLAADGVDIPVIVLTAFGDVATAVEAMSQGALDFLEKPFSRHKLLERIRQALDLRARRCKQEKRFAAVSGRLAALTAREREVMDLMVAGNATKQIGAHFGIGVKTVAKHRAKVLEKMQVENTVDLVHLAYYCDLVQDAPRPRPRRA